MESWPPPVRRIIAQYAVRCESCLHYLTNNGLCRKCNVNKPEEPKCVLWQSVDAYRNDNLPLAMTKRIWTYTVDFSGNWLGRSSRPPLALRTYTPTTWCLGTTFIVVEQCQDRDDSNRHWLLLSYCVDHDKCLRHDEWCELCAVVTYGDQWRPMSKEEANHIFIGFSSLSWSKYRTDVMQLRQYGKRM